MSDFHQSGPVTALPRLVDRSVDDLESQILRLSRRFSVGRLRLRANASLYNVFNNDFVNSVNTTFSTTASNAFMRPTAVLQGRLFKVGAQVDF